VASYSAVDIGILTIRDDEFRAVLAAFPNDPGVFKGYREYSLRTADAGSGARYRIAVLRQIEQGNGEAQEAARDLIDDLSPSLLLVVGIAGGLPSDDVTLGDVVLSTRINDYTLEARKWRERSTYNIGGGPVAKSIAASVANLAGRQDELGNWTSVLPERPKVMWTRKDSTYGPKAWRGELKDKLEAHFGDGATPRQPTFIAGAIASSDRLIKDPTVLFPWIQTARHLAAIEMESGGVYRAARDRCPMMAIRGISDIVGLKRQDSWTKYACSSAAAFARAYLRTRPVEPREVAPEREDRAKGSVAKSKGGTTQSEVELFTNLVPVVGLPEKLYISASTCKAYKQAWAILLKQNKASVTRAWALHGDNLYSLEDPSTGSLRRIADESSTEEHSFAEFGNSEDPDQQRIFMQIMFGALRDGLGSLGIWYHPKDDVFAFAGRLDERPRVYKYKNVHVRSTMTVVSHYASRSKDGRKFKYLRHLAFGGRFRYLDRQWFLEITPTYRFTTDGRTKDRFHEERLSGIKRLEGNRAVLSQVLLWNDVLWRQALGRENRPFLTFGSTLFFRTRQPISDSELSPVDARAVSVAPSPPSDEPSEAGGDE
jgi:nucleoside phosphorylase